jgi:signal transduction histidine kinase
MVRRRPVRSARRLLLIFATTILAPGVILAGFGLRALTQERQNAERQVRDTLEFVARNLGRRLENDLRDWQQAAAKLARGGSVDPARWPARVGEAVMTPGAGVVLLGSREHSEAYPRGQLLYELAAAPEDLAPPRPSARFTEAESLELRKQYDQAIPLYRRLAASTDRTERTLALHALGRSMKNAKQRDGALDVYQRLAQEPPIRIAGMYPSDLLALSEIASNGSPEQRGDASLALYRGLVGARWRLDKVVYYHYSEQLAGSLPENHETHRLREQEARKLSLGRAAERFVETPRTLSVEDGSATLAFWNERPFGAIVLGADYVRDHLLPAVERPDVRAALSTRSGEHLAGPLSVDDPLAITHSLQGDVPLSLQVWRTDPAALAAVEHRQQMFLAMLAVLVALLGFGAYITLRTVRAELAVAQMKSDFVSTVSHEFRSPLASINQLGEMLRDGIVGDDSRRQEYYGMIVTESQRLRRLVENVLDFARMEDGRKQYRFEAVDSARWLREVAGDFQAQVAQRGFAVETEIPSELPPILVDRENLTTAVTNLLDNAVKYSPESRTVRLEAHASGEDLSIAVRDRGIGIGEEDRPRIFDKFYRGGGELSREVKGVGLGLNLVHHIVSAHGGTIDVESRLGEGSTFTIRLKAAT